MKIIIQCAGTKQKNAGCFKTKNGKNILFVAKPELAKDKNGYEYITPNDISNNNISWVEELKEYNRKNDNYFNLLPAYKLYQEKIYEKLVDKFGINNVYILSAGWGLVQASYLLPNYNITFSRGKNVADEFRRSKNDKYDEISGIDSSSKEELIFLGGKDYQDLFDRLTSDYKGNRIIYYKSKNIPKIKNVSFVKYESRQSTNWHYTCAMKIIDNPKYLRT